MTYVWLICTLNDYELCSGFWIRSILELFISATGFRRSCKKLVKFNAHCSVKLWNVVWNVQDVQKLSVVSPITGVCVRRQYSTSSNNNNNCWRSRVIEWKVDTTHKHYRMTTMVISSVNTIELVWFEMERRKKMSNVTVINRLQQRRPWPVLPYRSALTAANPSERQ